LIKIFNENINEYENNNMILEKLNEFNTIFESSLFNLNDKNEVYVNNLLNYRIIFYCLMKT
jgi:hypothetical protein